MSHRTRKITVRLTEQEYVLVNDERKKHSCGKTLSEFGRYALLRLVNTDSNQQLALDFSAPMPADDFIDRWRASHAEDVLKYQGKYVAIRLSDGKILASGTTLGEVVQPTNGHVIYDVLPREPAIDVLGRLGVRFNK